MIKMCSLINFFVILFICLQTQESSTQESLNQLIVSFKGFQEDYKSDIKTQRLLYRYQDACQKAYDELQCTSKATPHVWYRAALARVIYDLYSVSLDNEGKKSIHLALQVFKHNIEPWLCGSDLIKKIKRVDYLCLFHKDTIKKNIEGVLCFNIFYKYYQLLHERGILEYPYKQTYPEKRSAVKSGNMPSDDPKKFYYSKYENDQYSLYLTSEDDSGSGKCLFVAPSDGMIFLGGSCYGMVDLVSQKVFMYVRLPHEVSKVDLSHEVPYCDAIGIKSVNILHQGSYLVLIFTFKGSEPKRFFYYKVVANPDCSVASNYY